MSTRIATAAICACTFLIATGTARATDTDCDAGELDSQGLYCQQVLTTDLIPDVSVSGTLIGTWTGGTDDGYAEVSFANAFRFYGTEYTTMYVSVNGYVSFGAGSTVPGNLISVPSPAAPNNAIYAYGDDLDLIGGGSVRFAETSCTVDRNADGSNDACVVVQWTGIRVAGNTPQVTAQLALDTDSDEALIEIESETGLNRRRRPRVVGTEDQAGLAGLWYKLGNATNSAAVTAGYQLFFSQADIFPPSDISKLTATSHSAGVELEWTASTASDWLGTLVLQESPSEVTGTPTRGVTYQVGDMIGSSQVVCVEPLGSTACSDALSGVLGARSYKAFAFDQALNYAGGLTLRVEPNSAARWGFHTNASALAPPGALPEFAVIAAGNDALLHRARQPNGTRGNWNPPNLAGAIQARPMIGDLDVSSGATNQTAFFGAQSGWLYRFGLDDSTDSADAARNVAGSGGDAGCTSGALQASPVAMLDAFDVNAVDGDDAVVVATRCGATDNRILLFPLDLSSVLASYDGGPDGLGISNGAPTIHYRDDSPNLVYVPVRSAGNESLVVLEVLTGPSFGSTPYAVLSGIGDIDAAPVLFDRTSSPLLLVGGSDGTLRVYDALARVAGAGSELQLLQTIAGSDGAVRGIAVSRPIDDGLGGSSRWVVWTTTSLTQGVRIDQTGALVAGSSWSVPVSGPSAPLVLNDVLAPGDVLAYVGTTGGTLLELDAASGLTSRSWPLAAAATVGDPTFDYGDGTAQGVVAGTSSGAIYWVPISAP
jgi:hypothetical protein